MEETGACKIAPNMWKKGSYKIAPNMWKNVHAADVVEKGAFRIASCGRKRHMQNSTEHVEESACERCRRKWHMQNINVWKKEAHEK